MDRRGVLTWLLVSSAAACGGAALESYRAPGHRELIHTAAVMPLAVMSAKPGTAMGRPAWLKGSRVRLSIPKQELIAAQTQAFASLRAALPQQRFVSVREVEELMTGKQQEALAPTMAAGLVARRAHTQVALLITMEDYSLEPDVDGSATFSALVKIAAHLDSARVLCSVAGTFSVKHSTKGGLQKLTQVALDRMAPQLDELLTPR